MLNCLGVLSRFNIYGVLACWGDAKDLILTRFVEVPKWGFLYVVLLS